MSRHLLLASDAEDALAKLPEPERRRVIRALARLANEAGPAEHVLQLPDSPHPWYVVRVRSFRIVFRPLTRDEQLQQQEPQDGILVAAIMNRPHLPGAIRRLSR
jgi:hypothetical protein